jgi:glycosyltransferase involved in cell wall biosynthesis
MDVITIASLFPNSEQPRHGIFVEERLWHLRQACDFRFHVIAPVPWFPSGSRRFGEYGMYARIPREEERRGLLIHHPRFPTIPKVGMSVQPFLYAAAIAPMVRSLVRRLEGPVLLDGQFLYPDGVATALLARWLDLPFILTARGNDVTLYPRHTVPRRLVQWACSAAKRVITVSDSLRDQLLALGLEPDRVITLRNGVDLQRFRPVDVAEARQRTGISRPTVVAVGHLIPRKDHELLIRAMALLPGIDLVIIGEGPLRDHLHNVARACGMGDRLRILGNMSQADLLNFYSAADLTALTSRNEGMANVLLESMACGTPVVATVCEGVPELFTDPAAGRMVLERTPAAVAEAIAALLASPPGRTRTRAYAETLGWPPTIEGLRGVLRLALDGDGSAGIVATHTGSGPGG